MVKKTGRTEQKDGEDVNVFGWRVTIIETKRRKERPNQKTGAKRKRVS